MGRNRGNRGGGGGGGGYGYHAHALAQYVAPAQTDSFNIRVCGKADGQQLPEVFASNGTRYIVAEPDEEFEVRVQMHNQSNSDYKLYCKIDGIDVGYSKVLVGSVNRHREAVFEGWLGGAGAGPIVYNSFKFAPAAAGGDDGGGGRGGGEVVVQHLDELKSGRISVNADAVLDCGERGDDAAAAATTPVDPASAPRKVLPPGKKQLLAPGLKAAAGSAVQSKTNWNTRSFQVVAALPAQEIRYDSAAQLLMRKVLDPGNAAHRAILRQSKNPRIAALGREGAAPNVKPEGGGGGGSGSSRGVKRERGEGGGGGALPASATAEKVDLTGEGGGGRLLVDGREVGAGEVAVCDLLDSDDEAGPSWTVQRKEQRVEADGE